MAAVAFLSSPDALCGSATVSLSLAATTWAYAASAGRLRASLSSTCRTQASASDAYSSASLWPMATADS